MLEALTARLGQEQVRERFAQEPGPIDRASFSARLAAVASERRLGLLLCLAGGERSVRQLAGLCHFDPAIAAEDLELLRRHELVNRQPDGTYRICCSELSPAVRRLVDLIVSRETPKEAT
jgi:hypothetical protein